MLDKLLQQDFIFFDGAIGWILLRKGLKAGQRPDIMNIIAPDAVYEIQHSYYQAGSDILLSNTLGANAVALKATGYSVEEIIRAGVGIAKKAGEGKALTALDIGPIGEFISPFGNLSFDDSYELYRQQAVIGEAAGADLVALETMSDLLELKAAMLAVKENTSLPVFAMMTFDKSGRTFTGCRPESFAVMAERLGAAAIGINCSLRPDEIYPMAEKVIANTHLPVIIKPNAGLPDSVTGLYDVDAAEFARQMAHYAELGVKIVGGCCGTSPEYITHLHRVFDPMKPAEVPRDTAVKVCTPMQIERTADLRAGVRLPDIADASPESIIENALDQADNGQKILTVSFPDGISPADAELCVKSVQFQSDRPLYIVSNDTAVLMAALRAVTGVPAVSCPLCTHDKLKDIAARYGAVVISDNGSSDKRTD